MTKTALSVAQLEIEFAELLKQGWQMDTHHKAITKTFTFKSFSAAFAWMAQLAQKAEQLNHHPDWCNSYRRVWITLTTHSVNGLTLADRNLAQWMEHYYEP